MPRAIHLQQRLAQDLDDLVFVGGIKRLVLVLQKHQAQRVLHHLHVRVLLDSLLHQDRRHAVAVLLRIAGFLHDLLRDCRVMPGQRLAPRQVTDAAFRIAGARDFPTADVLAPGRQDQRLGRVRRQLHHPFVQLLRKKQLLWTGLAFPREHIGIGGVVLVEAAQGLLQAVVHGMWLSGSPACVGQGEVDQVQGSHHTCGVWPFRIYRGNAGAGVSGPTGAWPGRGGMGGSHVRVGGFSPG